MISAIYAVPVFALLSSAVADMPAMSEATFSTWEHVNENVFDFLKEGYRLVEYKQKDIGRLTIENFILQGGSGIIRCENLTDNKMKSTNSLCQRFALTPQTGP